MYFFFQSIIFWLWGGSIWGLHCNDFLHHKSGGVNEAYCIVGEDERCIYGKFVGSGSTRREMMTMVCLSLRQFAVQR